MRFSKSRTVAKPAPRLGEHNVYVLQGRLGLGAAEVDDLMARQVIGTVPLTWGDAA